LDEKLVGLQDFILLFVCLIGVLDCFNYFLSSEVTHDQGHRDAAAVRFGLGGCEVVEEFLDFSFLTFELLALRPSSCIWNRN